MLFTNDNPNCSYFLQMNPKQRILINPASLSNECRNRLQRGISNQRKCACFSDTVDKAMTIIRVNETIWFDWIKNVVGYADEYMPNYFIRRFVRHTDKSKLKNIFLQGNFNRYFSFCLLFNFSLSSLSSLSSSKEHFMPLKRKCMFLEGSTLAA